MDRHAQDGDDGLIFTSPTGTPLRHSNFYRRAWLPALEQTGIVGLHFHIWHGSGTKPEASLVKIIYMGYETASDLRRKGCAPSAT